MKTWNGDNFEEERKQKNLEIEQLSEKMKHLKKKVKYKQDEEKQEQKAVFSLFLGRYGGITCKVNGSRRCSRDLPQGGLEILAY